MFGGVTGFLDSRVLVPRSNVVRLKEETRRPVSQEVHLCVSPFEYRTETSSVYPYSRGSLNPSKVFPLTKSLVCFSSYLRIRVVPRLELS